MTDLPPGWAWATLEDLLAAEPRAITDGPFGSKLASKHYTTSGARVIRLQNIGDGFFRDERAYISNDYFEELRNHEVRAGDLVIASLGEVLPRACIVPDIGPAIVKADCIRARIHPEIDARWVLYMLSAPATRRHAMALIKGVGRPRLGLGAIRKIPIPVPPLAEQHRIVATLEGHLSRLDSATELIGMAAARTEKLERAISDQILMDLMSNAPIKPLSSLLREPLRNGHSARASKDGSGVRTLTLTAVTKNEFTDHNTKMTAADPGRVRELWLEPGDILVQRSNTPELVGTSALYMGKSGWAIFPDLLIRVRTNDSVIPEYVYLILSAPSVRAYFRASAKGLAGSMPKIDQDTILRVTLPVPSLETQRKIVYNNSNQNSEILRLRESLSETNRRSQQLRRSLFGQAFAGVLVPQNPRDEPAFVLLSKLQDQRANLRSTLRSPRRSASKPPQEETLL